MMKNKKSFHSLLKKIIDGFDNEKKRKLLVIIPDNAQKHLKF